MKIRRAVPMFIVLVLIIAASLSLTGRTTHAQSSVTTDPIVLAKLEEIVSNQKQIMAELASLKAELEIVKIRVTQSQ